MISLDGKTGKRRWSIPDEIENMAGGAPLILNDPENVGGPQIVYHATISTAWAIKTTGEIVWKVPTNLNATMTRGDRHGHVWGCNLHLQTDSIVILTSEAEFIILDRRSGFPLLDSPHIIGGSVAKGSTFAPPQFVLDAGNRESQKMFPVHHPLKRPIFGQIMNAIFGNSSQVANFFAIDPNTGNIFIAATDLDENDGTVDGASENGAVYKFTLSRKNDGRMLTAKMEAKETFLGGTGSTPTVSADSSRVLLSDDNNCVLAFDSNLKLLWKVDVQHQVAASIAYATDNREAYVVTKVAIYKIRDHGKPNPTTHHPHPNP